MRRCSERISATIRPPKNPTPPFQRIPVPFIAQGRGRYKLTTDALNASYFLPRFNPSISFLPPYGSTYDLGHTNVCPYFVQTSQPIWPARLLSYQSTCPNAVFPRTPGSCRIAHFPSIPPRDGFLHDNMRKKCLITVYDRVVHGEIVILTSKSL
jgi:hypothetical protein